jgi:uncharacterized glyoxalase superfamily protein PhnB
MSEETLNDYREEQAAAPSQELKQLDRLVGTWKMSGEAKGQIRYEWMDGGFFLVQYVDLEQDGHQNKGIEIIGQERGFGSTEPGKEIKSRYYGSQGETFDYVYELEDDFLTIWGGERGSPAYYQGRFSEDGDTLTGAWVWPGGGYEATANRVSLSHPALDSNRSMPTSTVIPELAYREVAEAVEWLGGAFGFVEHLRIGNHRAQLTFDQGSLIVTQGDLGKETGSPGQGQRTHSVMVRVKDVNQHHERAVQRGARIIHPPEDYPYGERQYAVEDLGGHVWTFSQTIADVDPSSWGGRLSDQT